MMVFNREWVRILPIYNSDSSLFIILNSNETSQNPYDLITVVMLNFVTYPTPLDVKTTCKLYMPFRA